MFTPGSSIFAGIWCVSTGYGDPSPALLGCLCQPPVPAHQRPLVRTVPAAESVLPMFNSLVETQNIPPRALFPQCSRPPPPFLTHTLFFPRGQYFASSIFLQITLVRTPTYMRRNTITSIYSPCGTGMIRPSPLLSTKKSCVIPPAPQTTFVGQRRVSISFI